MRELVMIAPLPALRKRTRLAKMVPVFLDRGYSIRFFGWQRETGEVDEFAWQGEGVKEHVILRGGGYASSRARLLYPLWMIVVFFRVLILPRRSTLLCLGWETAFPALIAARLTGAKIVFDDADRFSMIIRLPGPIGNMLKKLERWASYKAAVHIVPSLARYEWHHSRMFILRNTPRYEDFVKAKQNVPARPDHDLVLYANGWIGETRGAPIFLACLQAARQQGLDLHLVIAGRVDGKSAPALISDPNVTFLGEVAQHEALSWYGAVDAVLTYYDPSVAINRKAESNKWGDAIYFDCPIIVNSEVETAEPLIAAGAALDVPYHNTVMLLSLLSNLAKQKDVLIKQRTAVAEMKASYPLFEEQLVNILKEVG